MYRIDKQYIENISLQKTIDIKNVRNVITPLKHWRLFCQSKIGVETYYY
jgi:hypothetical protein